MEGFYIWIRNIVCYLCLFHIFQQILPGGSFRKYVRFFGGLILVVLVMGPLADMAHLTEQFERAWNLESLREQAEEMRMTSRGMEELRSEKINEAYEEELKRQIEGVVKAYGMAPEETELAFVPGGQGIRNLSEVHLTVSFPDRRSGDEPAKIKNELREVYHISSEHINISIQE